MNIIKTGSKVLTIGNHFMQFGKTLAFGSVQSPISLSSINQPNGIAIDPPSAAFPNGRIFACNAGNNTISIIDYSTLGAATPALITSAQGSFSSPRGIAIDPPSAAFPNGRIFVANTNSTVSILNYTNPTAGSPTVISGLNTALSTAIGIAVDKAKNRILVTSNNSYSNVIVLDYNNPTTIITEILSSASTCGVAIDPAGNRIFVVNSNNTVSIFNYTNPTAGSPTIISTAQGGFNQCYGLALDAPNNRIFVSNAGNSSVSILNYTNPTAGSPTIISGFGGNRSIAIDAVNNRILVPNILTNNISIISNIFT